MKRERKLENEKGQALIEFALTAMLTFLFILGMIDFSRAVYTASIVQWAAQQGARAGVAEADTDVIVSAAKEKLVMLDPDIVEVEVYPPDLDDETVIVQVTVAYDFEFIVPVISAMVGEGLELRGTASMVRH